MTKEIEKICQDYRKLLILQCSKCYHYNGNSVSPKDIEAKVDTFRKGLMWSEAPYNHNDTTVREYF